MSKNEVDIEGELLDKIKKLLNDEEAQDDNAQGDNKNSKSPVATSTVKSSSSSSASTTTTTTTTKKFKFYDLERTESVQDEELLFINGTQIKLTLPEERELISNCLATGRVDDYGLLQRILENSGLAILPDARLTSAITTNLNVKQMNVVEEAISIKRINNTSGQVVEVQDRQVNTTANESFVEHVNVLRDEDEDQDETDDIRMRIFQNIIEEDSGIQDEHLDYLDRFPGLRNGLEVKFGDLRDNPRAAEAGAAPHGYSNNSLDGFYSTDLSTSSSSASTLGQQQQQQQPQPSRAHANNINPSSSTSTTTSNNHENVLVAAPASSLVYREGLLISGDLDTLIQHCMPTESYEPCSNYLFTFLLCGRLFISTGALLRRILDDIEVFRGDRHKTLGLILTHWVQKCPYDFLNPLLMQLLERECLISITGPLRESILRELKVRLERVRLYQNYLSLLRQITVSNERLLDAPVCEEDERGGGGGNRDSAVSGSSSVGDRSSGGSAILGGSGGLLHDHHHQPLNGHVSQGIDNIACESPYVNMEEALVDPSQDSQQQYEEFHLSTLYANNANRKNVHRIGELKAIVRSYQASLCDMTTAAQVAHQLTHIEVERLSFIGPEEFVQAFVKQQRETEKAGRELVGGDEQQHQLIKGGSGHIRTPSKDARRESANDESMPHRKLTQNLENYVQWFNRLTYLVASDIVKKNVKKKVRAKCIDFWIEVAHECFNIGNFNSLMAITTALNLSSISRLKKTWSKVQLRAKFQILEHQMDPSSNFCSYRSTLKAAMWRSAGATQVDNDRSRIIIPFFSLLVKDLYFLNEGCMSKLPNGHVNFEKLWLLSQQIREFMEWQKVHVPFEKHPSVIFYLETRPILETENQIAFASFECETPDNGADKDRFKSLKRN